MEATLLVAVLLLSGVNTLGGSNKVQVLHDGSPYVQMHHALYFGKTLYSRNEEPYYAFMGMRYASTPKRFEKSVLMSDLEEMPVPVLAQSMGSACPQTSPDGAKFVGKEDCLFANIYVPARDPLDEDGFPVIVFIHPGSFMSGSGGAFNVKYFMDENVIYATFNFRLGALGFLSTEDGVIPGNLGLHDQITFLEWVRENIEEFGGNKKRITISGIEAGAASVQYLLLSQHSQGLFQSAIVHGGSALTSYLSNSTAFSKQVSEELECPHQPSRLLVECLKIKRLRDLIQIQKSVSEKYFNFSSPFLPSNERCRRANQCSDSFLTKSPVLLLSERQYKRVPLLIGMKSDARLHQFMEELNHNVNATSSRSFEEETVLNMLESIQKHVPVFLNNDFSRRLMEIQRLYFHTNTSNNSMQSTASSLSNFLYDTLVGYGVWKFAMIYAQDKPVYPYIITFQGSNKSIIHGNSIDRNEGLLGGTEFLTPSLPEHHEFERGSDEEVFSQHLVHLWAVFATHQKPVDVWQNKETWLPLSASQVNGEKPVTWYALDKNVHQIEEPFTRRMKFLDKVFQQTI